MATVFDYLKWRGDLSFSQDPLNPVDGLIFSVLSYIPFVGQAAETPNEPIALRDAAADFLSLDDYESRVRAKNDAMMLRAAAETARFGGCKMVLYRDQFAPEEETQFAAMTFLLPDDTAFVAFRGTDRSLVGWKEDFNMAFQEAVPAQLLAQDYVREVAAEYGMPLRLGGHSKGGNLAVYAAAFCDDGVQKRITSVFNYDGPGFDDRVLRTESYKRICKRIMTFVPQSSVIGMLLGHEEAYTIVHSEQTGMMQHDVYSWDVRRDGFDCLEQVDNSSRFVDFTLKAWITDLDYKQRESFFDTVYTVMKETNASTLREMGENWFASAVSVLKSIKNLDEATRKAALRTLGLLVKCAGMGISHMWQTREKTEAPAKTEEKS